MGTLYLGTCEDDPNTINKSPTLNTSTDCYVKEPCSIEAPVFIVNYSSTFAGYNYASYGDFGRYYYINDIVMAPGGKAEIHCTCDPLYTFRSDINNLECYISRIGDQNKRAAYLSDPTFPVSGETYCKNIPLGGSNLIGIGDDNTYSYVLTVMGGYSRLRPNT